MTNTFNRLHNCTNPYQGKAKRVLCVCSAGLLRSPTAANVLHREFGYNTRACGVSEDYALIPIDDVLMNWADEIVVMEDWMKDQIPEAHQSRVYVLGVKDMYGFMDEELQGEIKAKYISQALPEGTVVYE